MVPGQGMVLALADGTTATVYGIGPIWYWDVQEIDRPTVGEEVSSVGYTVDFNGEYRNILMTMTVTVDGMATPIQLRDPGTGAPLWRGGRNR
jgi:hypothetical protein